MDDGFLLIYPTNLRIGWAFCSTSKALDLVKDVRLSSLDRSDSIRSILIEQPAFESNAFLHFLPLLLQKTNRTENFLTRLYKKREKILEKGEKQIRSSKNFFSSFFFSGPQNFKCTFSLVLFSSAVEIE